MIANVFSLNFLTLITSVLAHPGIESRFAPIMMGLAAPYGAVMASTLTSTGATDITGSCGTCPGTAITGFPPGVCTVTTSAGGTAGCAAKASCLNAYNTALAAGLSTALVCADLGGLTLKPGVYTFPINGVTLTGILALNGTRGMLFSRFNLLKQIIHILFQASSLNPFVRVTNTVRSVPKAETKRLRKIAPPSFPITINSLEDTYTCPMTCSPSTSSLTAATRSTSESTIKTLLPPSLAHLSSAVGHRRTNIL